MAALQNIRFKVTLIGDCYWFGAACFHIAGIWLEGVAAATQSQM